MGERQASILIIEPMRFADVSEVCGIERMSYRHPWTREMFLSELRKSPYATCLVGRQDERIVGYGIVEYILEEAHCINLAVHPSYRRQKIGERIFLALVRRAIERGAERLTLEVRESNRAAQRLYAKFGLRVVGVRHRYYPPDGENAMIMWVEDLQTPAYAARLRAIEEEEVRVNGSWRHERMDP
ncbi:MAG: ribosomal protein S18-alanine N-acetyltransferase [Abditibacteriales bacterium]|nr:ribosomal protein S18-alanine N-acetyltransferase [Abditibacteriales bacterium]MDW8365184.1 ribosomal protein S18-alanine N-acetyltransferase [Abditibacteriales bacterium]